MVTFFDLCEESLAQLAGSYPFLGGADYNPATFYTDWIYFAGTVELVPGGAVPRRVDYLSKYRSGVQGCLPGIGDRP